MQNTPFTGADELMNERKRHESSVPMCKSERAEEEKMMNRSRVNEKERILCVCVGVKCNSI